jgi:hypothetical protein
LCDAKGLGPAQRDPPAREAALSWGGSGGFALRAGVAKRLSPCKLLYRLPF